MRAYNSAASEAQAVTDESECISMPPPISEAHATETALDSDDGASNSWVEALLRDSSAEMFNFGSVRLDAARRVVICNGRYARFAPLDFALLLVLARNRNKMMSYARISRQLWGPNRKMSVPRLRVRVFRVRQRLEEERMDDIRIVNRGGLGYVIELDSAASHSNGVSKKLESVQLSNDTVRVLRPTAAKIAPPRIATAAE